MKNLYKTKIPIFLILLFTNSSIVSAATSHSYIHRISWYGKSIGLNKLSINLIICAILYYVLKNEGIKINNPFSFLFHKEEPMDTKDIESEDSLIFKIKRLNPDFDIFNFKNNITDMYLSTRQAYKEKNLNNIKSFQSNELYEKQSKEILNYIELNQTNITDNIIIDSIKILSCNNDLSSNSIKIKTQIKVRQINYIIEDSTHRIIGGHPKVLQRCTYEWTILYKTTYDSSNNIQHIYIIDSIQ